MTLSTKIFDEIVRPEMKKNYKNKKHKLRITN